MARKPKSKKMNCLYLVALRTEHEPDENEGMQEEYQHQLMAALRLATAMGVLTVDFVIGTFPQNEEELEEHVERVRHVP